MMKKALEIRNLKTIAQINKICMHLCTFLLYMHDII